MAKKAAAQSSGAGTSGDQSNAPPATGPGSRPRKAKAGGPQWFTARMSDGKYRIIEHVSPEAVAALIVTVTPTQPEDFVSAGRDEVTLERYGIVVLPGTHTTE